MWTKLWMLGLLALLVACGSQKSVKPPIPQTLGLLKVTITGITEGASPRGEGASPTATAQWVQSVGTGSGVSTQAATVIPVNGSSSLGDVQLIRRLVSFEDDDLADKRFVRATFDIVNRSITTFNNFTLYAVNVPGNIGGTGIVALSAGTGAAITDPNIARGFKPTHGMRPSLTALEVHPIIADLQLFTPGEALSVQNQGLTTPDPFNPGNNILPVGSTVLEYGFVARNLSGGRTIVSPNTSIPSDCTTSACKGTVTVAYQFPKVSPRNANPFAFSLYFVVANETVQMGSQSVEEQTPNTVMGLSSGSVGSFAQIRTLLGSTFSGGNKNDLCSVRTAIPTVSNPGNLYLPITIPNAPGSLDVCFDTDGKVTTPIGSDSDEARSLALQSDGKIVVAGTNSNDFALARYNLNGTLDTTFGTGGKQTTGFGADSDQASSVAIQPDNKIVVGGLALMSTFDFALARYNTDGSLDTSFDTDGKVTTNFLGPSTDQARSLAIQPDGKIVLAGFSDNDFALARYNSDGTLDATFDLDGKVTTSIALGIDAANAIAIQGDGKIVVAGVGNSDFVLVRYNPNGSLDTSFGSGGIQTTDFGSATDQAHSLAIQSDGKIVVAGVSSGNFALARYNSDGSLDTTFGSGGKQTTDFASTNDQARSIAIQPSGKIVLGGTSNNDFALARYNSDGTLDISFDSDGKVVTSIGSGDDRGSSLAIQADGKIVLAGSSFNGLNYDFALARYNP